MNPGLYIASALVVAVLGWLVWDISKQKAKQVREEQPEPVVAGPVAVQGSEEQLQPFPPVNRPVSPPVQKMDKEALPPVERVVVRHLDTPVIRELQQLVAIWDNRVNTIPYGSPPESSGYRDALCECRDDLMGVIADLEALERQESEDE